jgi:hypothetical protein
MFCPAVAVVKKYNCPTAHVAGKEAPTDNGKVAANVRKSGVCDCVLKRGFVGVWHQTELHKTSAVRIFFIELGCYPAGH